MKIEDKLLLEHRGKKYWFFHGDVFDLTMKHSKWLAKLGGKGYDYLILFNRFINKILEKTGHEKISLSKKVKGSVKHAVKFISDFEQTAADLAMDDHYEFVICGHIHQPIIKDYEKGNKRATYMNSGDWIENLSALECDGEEWKIAYFNAMNLENENSVEDDKETRVDKVQQLVLQLNKFSPDELTFGDEFIRKEIKVKRKRIS